MAKGSVRKKGKKWYYRFYVEDASGNLVQKEFAGTENKSETEKLLRQAMEDYEAKRFVAKAENIEIGDDKVKEEIEKIFEKCGLPLNIRGEALTLEQFAMLANCIYEEKNNK